MLINKSSDRSFFPILYFSTKYLIMFGKVMDQGPHGPRTIYCILCFHCHAIKNEKANQYRKSRIWEIEEDKYTSQESGLWNNPYVRCSQKRFTQICKALYGDAMLMSIWGAQIWLPETDKNIWFGVFLLMHEFIAWGIHKYDLTLHNIPYGFPCSNGQQFLYSSLAVQTAWTICSKKLSSVWTTWDIRLKKIVIPSNS